MKILHVTLSLDPRTGGPGNVIRNVVQGQLARGHQVSVLSTSIQVAEPWTPRDQFIRDLKEDPHFAGAEIRVARAYGRRRAWAIYGFSPAGNRWLRRRLSDPHQAPDVVHVHGVWAHLTTAAAAWARRRGLPYVIRPAGSLDAVSFQANRHRLKKAFVHLFLEKDIRHAACLQATSEVEAQDLRRWVPRERIRVVPHGVDVPEFDRHAAARAFLLRYPQLRARRIVFCMARLNPIKRIDLLVEAMAILRGESPDLALVVAGQDDGHMAAVRDAARRTGLEDSVVLTGFAAGELKRGAMAAAKLFALPSKHENFGVAVIEAMAHGLPALVTPEVASHLYVDQSGGGLTVEGNAQAIAGAMRSLLAADLEDLGRRARRFVQENLSWESSVRRLEGLYREIIAEASRRRTTEG